MSAPAPAPATPAAPTDWRRIVLPAEHGAWAFLGEPLLLGLVVAPTAAGVLVALAALAGFLARQPLKLAIGDRRRGRRYPRTRAAERAFAGLALVAALALAGALLLARGPLLWALGLAAPLAAIALAFDLAARPREAASEMAGALALASTAAAIALAAGWSAGPALGLWGVLAARDVPSVLYVRARLRLDRDQPAPIAAALLAQVVGIAAAIALARAACAPWLAVVALTLLALRAGVGLSRWRIRTTIPRFGLSELAFGLMVVALTAIGSARGL